MKKTFALITALLMSASMFTACLDDEEFIGDEDIEQSEPADKGGKPDVTTSGNNTGFSDSVSDTSAKSGKRSARTVINGNDDKFTVMVYMCGTDLETDGMAATADLLEMVEADLNDNVNLLVYTGGTKEWQNSFISNDTNQIWKAVHEDLECVEADMGSKAMTDPDTLSEFVSYCGKNYPANRNALILWDHGGGALFGYGTDEIYGGAMTIDQIDSALDKSGVSFDFIGFDACLMATVETAYMIDQHADYMIASEETEPGTGWFYTNWLNTICENPSTPTTDIGKIIVDDFIQTSIDNEPSDECTLSVIDLTEMQNVADKLDAFSGEAKDMMEADQFKVVSRSVSNTKSYAQGEYDTIDLMHFAQNLNTDSSKELISAIDTAVVYYKNSKNVYNSNGLTVYLPYKDLESFSQMTTVYDRIGINGQFSDFVKKFANMMAGGHIYNGSSSSGPVASSENGSSGLDFSSWEDYDWFDEDYVTSYADEYAENSYNAEDLEIEDRGDFYALSLSDEDWDNISDIRMQLFYDSGEGYIDLGTDDYFELDTDDALIVDFDGLWFTLGDYIVPLYIAESSEDYTEGHIPCLLNGEEVDLVVVWDEYNNGTIVGAQRSYNNGMSMKGLLSVNDGDVLQILCDYYEYDGNYDDSYLYSDEFVYDSSMYVDYYPAGEGDYLLYFIITDIYGNDYYTEPVTITFDEDYFFDEFPEYFE